MKYDLKEFADFLDKESGFVRESNKVALREGDELVSALQNETNDIICDLMDNKKLCYGGESTDGAVRFVISDKCGNILYIWKYPRTLRWAEE